MQERALGEAGRIVVQNLYSSYHDMSEVALEQFHSQPYDDLIEENGGAIGAANQGNAPINLGNEAGQGNEANHAKN